MINDKIRTKVMDWGKNRGKNWILVLALGCMTLGSFTSCGDDDDDSLPTVTPVASGVLQDKDGNEYKWVRIGNQDWMADNLRVGLPFYEDTYNDKWGRRSLYLPKDLGVSEQIYDTFGNYYSWQEAMDNAPEGWRLPTDDDWKTLERTLGMNPSDLDKEGWRSGASYLMVQDGEGTQLNLRYGGNVCFFGFSLSIYHFYDYGYYWTATSTKVNNEPAAYARVITPSRNAVNRLLVLQEERFMSVRYVRDVK